VLRIVGIQRPGRTLDANEPATWVGRTWDLHVVLALRVGEELKTQKSSRLLNSPADAARGSSRADVFQTSTDSPAICAPKPVS